MIFYYLTFSPCVKEFTNVLGEISEIFAVNFLKVHPLSVFPSCNCTLLRVPSMLHLLGALGNALFSHSMGRTWKSFDPLTLQEKLCVSVHTHMPLLPFPFTVPELILQAKQKILVPICSPPVCFTVPFDLSVKAIFDKLFLSVLVPTNRT